MPSEASKGRSGPRIALVVTEGFPVGLSLFSRHGPCHPAVLSTIVSVPNDTAREFDQQQDVSHESNIIGLASIVEPVNIAHKTSTVLHRTLSCAILPVLSKKQGIFVHSWYMV